MSRVDKDTMGEIAVPAEALWQSQTERSRQHFPFPESERMPWEVVTALIAVKLACAKVNLRNGKLTAELSEAIQAVCNDLLNNPDKYKHAFPLVVFQTGSGTQTNMNVNEVIASLANQTHFQKPLGSKAPVHPNDHVNCGQSSNDVFPTAAHTAILKALESRLFPALAEFDECLAAKISQFEEVVKVGRTHLMDAVPLTLGQEFSAYRTGFANCTKLIRDALPLVQQIALGGTAVGTGLNSKVGFDVQVAEQLSEVIGHQLVSNPNKFAALSTVTPLVGMAGALLTLGTQMSKMANDVRLLSSGPRCGLNELLIPQNEPGSSIMPGKVNPTQCESMAMVAVQVMGCCNTVTLCNLYGHLQLNVYYPVATANLLRSINLIEASLRCFAKHCLKGMEANVERINHYISNSLMLVTALNPVIGYDEAAKVAKYAHKENMTLKDAALQLRAVTDENEYDKYVDPAKMISPKE